MSRKLPELKAKFINPPMETKEDIEKIERDIERLYFKLFDIFLEWDKLKEIDDDKYKFSQEFKDMVRRLSKKIK